MTNIIDLNQKTDIEMIATKKDNYTLRQGQSFYKSPSGKMLHIAEQLPNGDYWIAKSFRMNDILVLN